MSVALYLLLMWFTWVFFLAVMHLRGIRDTRGFSRWNKPPAYAVLVVGLLLDASLNLTMCVPLLDPPRELLLTGKLKRLIQTDPGWRGDVACFLCRHYLIPADPAHCGDLPKK